MLGKDKEFIKSSLMSEGNWSQEDVQTAYRRAARVNIRNEFFTDMGLFTSIPIFLSILVVLYVENYQEAYVLAIVGFPACIILFSILRPFVHRVFLKKEIAYGKLLIAVSMLIGAVGGYFVGVYSDSMYIFLMGCPVGMGVGSVVGNWLSARLFKK